MKIVFLIYVLYISSLNASGFFYKYKNNRNNNYKYGKKCIKKIDEIDTKDFNLFVKKIKNIAGDLVIYIQFRSKDGDFDIDLSQSHISIRDRRGKRVLLKECNIPNFHIDSGEAKIFPIVFKDKAYKLKSPYTLYLKIYNIGEITLTNLKLGSESIVEY